MSPQPTISPAPSHLPTSTPTLPPTHIKPHLDVELIEDIVVSSILFLFVFFTIVVTVCCCHPCCPLYKWIQRDAVHRANNAVSDPPRFEGFEMRTLPAHAIQAVEVEPGKAVAMV
jgi:hypothetical protein